MLTCPLNFCSIRSRLRNSNILLTAATAALWSVPVIAERPQILFAQGQWAAVRYGAQCEAVARPLLPAARRQPQSRAGFRFAPAGRRVGEFHARLSRDPRPGSSVMLTIGDRPFLLIGRGDWAWSRGPAQDSAIIEAARAATSMRIESRDGSGRLFTDRYLLAGAPTAIDAAAAACAGKI
jgi:hypothetical protein